MKFFLFAAFGIVLLNGTSFAQATFDITGTPIPANLLQQNYGTMPKGIGAYDLSICNVTEAKQSVVSSRIYQALSNSNSALEPIGREIMLAAILRNQNRSFLNMLGVVLNSTTSVLSVWSSSRYKVPPALVAGTALGSVAGQQVISNLKPILSADQVEKFENQVLEPALVLDGGSCVERTVFVSSTNTKAKSQPLSFHIH